MCESAPIAQMQEKTKRILIVEDNVALRFTLSEWLRSYRYTVFEAASADEAVILLESSLIVDFVITDVQMPGNLDGFDLLRYINQSFPGLPVIVVSGNDTHRELKEQAILFFKKPYSLPDITSYIAKLLDHSNKQDKDYFNQ